MVVGEGFRLAMAGAAVGLPVALGLTRFMASLLFAVTPADLPTYAGITAAIGAVALVCVTIPLAGPRFPVLGVALAGVIGATVDSILGATVQELRRCDALVFPDAIADQLGRNLLFAESVL